MSFALFFLGEYANMILMSAMTAILFPWAVGCRRSISRRSTGSPLWLIAKICLVLFFFLWVRATFHGTGYDQLMRLGWKVFLPFSLFWVIATAGVLVAFDLLPTA